MESVLAEALSVDAFRVVGAVKVGRALDRHVALDTARLGIRIGAEALRTDTVVAGRGILAHRMTATGFVQHCTLVNVDTAAEGISSVLGFAAADEAADCVGAHGIRSTGLVLALVDVCDGAGDAIRIKFVFVISLKVRLCDLARF